MIAVDLLMIVEVNCLGDFDLEMINLRNLVK